MWRILIGRFHAFDPERRVLEINKLSVSAYPHIVSDFKDRCPKCFIERKPNPVRCGVAHQWRTSAPAES